MGLASERKRRQVAALHKLHPSKTGFLSRRRGPWRTIPVGRLGVQEEDLAKAVKPVDRKVGINAREVRSTRYDAAVEARRGPATGLGHAQDHAVVARGPDLYDLVQIGRASCRERGET